MDQCWAGDNINRCWNCVPQEVDGLADAAQGATSGATSSLGGAGPPRRRPAPAVGAQAAYERGGAIVGFDGAEFSVDGHPYLSFAAGATLLLRPTIDDVDGWAYGAVDAGADGWAYEAVGLWGWLPRCFFKAYNSERESPPPPLCNRVAKCIWNSGGAPCRCDE